MTPISDSLFPDLAPSIHEQIQALDLQIECLLYGRMVAGLSLSLDERRVLRLIRYRRGAANAITIAEMQKQMHEDRLSERQIKQIVRTLRINFRLPIGSNKGGLGGYFLMISPEDHAILSAQILDQVRAEIEVLRAVSSRRAALDLLGQLQLELENTTKGNHEQRI
jgi:hypothetical protein